MSVQIYLNSKYADKKLNGSKKSNLLFYFTSPIIPPPDHNMSIKVLNASIPVSFTLVNDSNNTLIIDSSTYTIGSGNYTALTLKDELETQLGSDFSVSFSSTTNKFTFTSLTNFTIEGSSTCLRLLGFEEGEDATSTDSSLTSTYSVDLSGDNVVYVDLCNISTQNLSSTTGSRTSVITSILNNVSHGSVLFYEDTSNVNIVAQEDHIAFLHIRLLGEDMDTCLDMNNCDWQLTLQVSFTERKPKAQLVYSFQDIYKQYIDKLNDSGKEPTSISQ